MSDELLRRRAREALLAGRLPDARPERIWGGRGIGARCAVCDEPIGPDQSELELQFALRDKRGPAHAKTQIGDSAEATSHVHVQCFAAWECELTTGPRCR